MLLFDKCGWGISFVHFKAGRVIKTINYIACLLDSSNCTLQK